MQISHLTVSSPGVPLLLNICDTEQKEISKLAIAVAAKCSRDPDSAWNTCGATWHILRDLEDTVSCIVMQMQMKN